jgi:hypothetical protein
MAFSTFFERLTVVSRLDARLQEEDTAQEAQHR